MDHARNVPVRLPARSVAWPDLVWSHFSRPRFGEFNERVAAASAAGFVGIGLYVDEYARLRDDEGRTPSDIRAVLNRYGMALVDVEATTGWWATGGEQFERCRRTEELAYEMADEFGVRYMQVIGPYDCGFEQAVDGFGGLCDRAARHGLLAGIEWLPFTNIVDAADAQAIVNAADRRNGGYCVDIWHHKRGADDVDLIRALEPERIFSIQMSDGAMRPLIDDYKADCLANRLPPGDGEFDCVGFVQLLDEMGVDAPFSVEVCSTQLWSVPAADAARVAAAGMRRVLACVEASDSEPDDETDAVD
jgi:sugar phosphate isomerase/epimerase